MSYPRAVVDSDIRGVTLSPDAMFSLETHWEHVWLWVTPGRAEIGDPKMRPVDDMSACHVNAAIDAHERLQCDIIDSLWIGVKELKKARRGQLQTRTLQSPSPRTNPP